jgi:hypothetical protein
MPSIFDLMPASLWPVQPFMPPSDPLQPPVWPSSSAAGWSMPRPAPPPGWTPAATDADTSVSEWDRAMRQALAANGSAASPTDAASAWSDQMLADAKRARDFVMWAFGPPSAARAAPTSTAMRLGAPQSFGETPSNVDAASAGAAPPPIRSPEADDANAASQAPAAANQQPDLGAAYGNRNIARQGERARAIAATRSPPAPEILDAINSLPRGIVTGLVNTASASGQAAQIEMQQPIDVPSVDEAMKIVEQHITGPLPKPQGLAGRVTETIGEFLGNPVSYLGPGSLAAKAVQAILAGIGSQAGGELARGTWAEPLARIGGGMLGGGAAASALARDPAAAEAAAVNAARGVPRVAGAPAEPSRAPPVEPNANSAELRSVDPVDVPLVPADVLTARDIQEFRARHNLPNDIDTAGVARTNVPGLEDQAFEGGSIAVRRRAGLPPAEQGTINSPFPLPVDKAHAEEDLLNQFKRAVEKLGLQSSDLDGRELSIYLSQHHVRSVCLG